ncbi:hypothetical protein TWF481_006585 [Arthrobotrys musiformis]|uniref:F-box domain-containing protein n=1 Tax=Arthrobotrys musiformis TaxID=47236 RepID=A0AAV9W8Y6_9PEZI
MDPWITNDMATLKTVSLAKSEFPEFLFLPRILPLPVELVQRVYTYLDRTDLAKLLSLKTMDSVKVPSSYWRSLFHHRAEFGYFYLDKTAESNQNLSWFQKFRVARTQLRTAPDSLKNRRRIWTICNGLADQIIDISGCQMQGLYPVNPVDGFNYIPEASPPRPNCWVQCEGYIHQGMQINSRVFRGSRAGYEGEIDVGSIEALLLSYSGSGSMLFLSGITVLPSGKQIGYITKRTRLVPWATKTVLSVALTTYGIVDISLSNTIHESNWMLSDTDFRERKIALKYRLLKNSTEGAKLQGRWDASKIIEMRITTSQILDDQSLNSEAETFIQNHCWTPSLPPSELDLNPYSYSGVLYLWEGAPRYCPLQYIVLPSSAPLTMITGWMTIHRLSALGFHFKDHPPMVLGEPKGTPSNFAINGEGGEEIASIHALLDKSYNDSLCGVMIETNSGRKARFCVEFLQQCLARSLLPPQKRSLRGFYGINKNFRLPVYDLCSIGAMTYPRVDNDVESEPPRELFSADSLETNSLKAENATFVRHIGSAKRQEQKRNRINIGAYDGDYHYRYRSLHVGSMGQFANTASLQDCNRVVCYKEAVPQSRIVGLQLYYKERLVRYGTPRILGRISDSAQDEKILDLRDGNGGLWNIVSLEIFTQEPSQTVRRNTFVSGLRMHLSNGQSILWGAEDAIKASKTLNLTPRCTLRWDYNERFDIISVLDED